MRKEPENGVVWISFDKKVPRLETDEISSISWLELATMRGIESFPTHSQIEYTPSNLKYWGSSVLIYCGSVLLSFLIAFIFCRPQSQPSNSTTTNNTPSQPKKPSPATVLPSQPIKPAASSKISLPNNPSPSSIPVPQNMPQPAQSATSSQTTTVSSTPVAKPVSHASTNNNSFSTQNTGVTPTGSTSTPVTTFKPITIVIPQQEEKVEIPLEKPNVEQAPRKRRKVQVTY